tara:strand:+ start:5049 stop:5222 length:174 start_codon:yes stop_codon:yes gene_type:complete
LRTVGEKIGKFWKKRKNTSFKLTSLVFVLAERERERERDECATERERERKEKRDVII